MAKRPNGVVIYEGPSVLTGDDIIVVVTFNSKNDKTGSMLQSWILRADETPLDASKHGHDDAVCGNCPLRRSLNGACYVNIGNAPNNVYKAHLAGNYPYFDLRQHGIYFHNRALRLGAYGDPAAVPMHVWDAVVPLCCDWSGYTHQLGHKHFDPDILKYCMVSVDTPAQAVHVQRHHRARTFRVKTPESPVLPGEVQCRYESDNVQCINCGLCSGGADAPNIYTTIHGPLASRYTRRFGEANKKGPHRLASTRALHASLD